MEQDVEIKAFLMRHLQSIAENDLEQYHRTTSEELTLYEWYITPHRLDGLAFHDFFMSESERRGSALDAQVSQAADGDFETQIRFDLSNLHIQRYGDCAIASYTMLVTSSDQDGMHVTSHNESRVMVKMDEGWKVVHAHKSPAWSAPHEQSIGKV